MNSWHFFTEADTKKHASAKTLNAVLVNLLIESLKMVIWLIVCCFSVHFFIRTLRLRFPENQEQFNPLSANLSVFDYFVILALKGLRTMTKLDARTQKNFKSEK